MKHVENLTVRFRVAKAEVKLSMEKWVTVQRGIGAELRAWREEQGVSLRGVAALLAVSAPYVSDLERGARHWDLERINNYIKAVRQLAKHEHENTERAG